MIERIEIDVPDILAQYKVPGVALIRTQLESGAGTPGCWFGGKPRLPAHIPWPVNDEWHDDPKMPMHFLCQLDLAQFPVAVFEYFDTLPRSGTLFFFYDAVYGGAGSELFDASAVIYVEEDVADIPYRDLPPVPDEVVENAMSYTYKEKGFGHDFPYWPITLYEVDTYPNGRWRQVVKNHDILSDPYKLAWEKWFERLESEVTHFGVEGQFSVHVALGACGIEYKKKRILFISHDEGMNLYLGDGDSMSYFIENEKFIDNCFSCARSLFDNYLG